MGNQKFRGTGRSRGRPRNLDGLEVQTSLRFSKKDFELLKERATRMRLPISLMLRNIVIGALFKEGTISDERASGVR